MDVKGDKVVGVWKKEVKRESAETGRGRGDGREYRGGV